MSDEIEKNFFPCTGMPDLGWWAELWPNPKETLRLIGINPDMTVLDLCCGNGHFTIPLADLADGKVYALDIYSELLEEAKSAAKNADVSVLKWICADAMDIEEVISKKVDFVVMANTFHGVQDKKQLAKNVGNILKPEGKFAIINWYPIPREQTVISGEPRGPKTEMRMPTSDVQDVVESAGFTLEKIIDVSPYHYAAIFRITNGDCHD